MKMTKKSSVHDNYWSKPPNIDSNGSGSSIPVFFRTFDPRIWHYGQYNYVTCEWHKLPGVLLPAKDQSSSQYRANILRDVEVDCWVNTPDAVDPQPKEL